MSFDFLNNPNPRIGSNAEYPGMYQFSTSLSNHITDPGARINLNVFVTGYGNIDNCKIHLNYPEDIFVYTDSFIYTDLKCRLENIDESTGLGDLILEYGRNKTALQKSGCLIGLDASGFPGKNWVNQIPTPFFDVSDTKTPQIATEKLLDKAPIECQFAISPNAKAGSYNIYLVLTYFNGNEWKGDRIEIPITVTTLFQRHEVLFTILAIALAVISIVFTVIEVV